MRFMENMNAPQNSSIYQPESGKKETPFAQTMVQLSKQEYIQLKWDSRYWRRQHDRALAREVVLKQENEHLQAQIRDLKQRLYGKSSEKTVTQSEAQTNEGKLSRPRGQTPNSQALCRHFKDRRLRHHRNKRSRAYTPN
jgi:hypothetical protein